MIDTTAPIPSMDTTTLAERLKATTTELDHLAEAWLEARVAGHDTRGIGLAIEAATRAYRKSERKLRKALRS